LAKRSTSKGELIDTAGDCWDIVHYRGAVPAVLGAALGNLPEAVSETWLVIQRTLSDPALRARALETASAESLLRRRRTFGSPLNYLSFGLTLGAFSHRSILRGTS
jgi:hypothetical protein